MFIADVNDISEKLFAGVNDTGETPAIIFLSLIPVRNNQKAENLSPVSTTPPNIESCPY
jgi:hypothetical protein